MEENVDEEIKLIKLKLQRLNEAYDTDLLAIKRFLARLAIYTSGQMADILILRSNFKIDNQLVDDAKEAFSALEISDVPLSIAEEFQAKCNAHLIKLGIPKRI